MDHTTQTETEFIDAIETPREELANGHAEKQAQPIETTVQEPTEKEEDAAKKHRAIQLAGSTMKAVKRRKKIDAATTNPLQADADQDATSSQEASAEQPTVAEVQIVDAVSEPETVEGEIEQTETGEVQEAEQTVETIELAEPISTEQSAEEVTDANAPTGKLSEIDATLVVTEQVEAAEEANDANTPTSKLSEIDSSPVMAEQTEVVVEEETVETEAEQADVVELDTVEVVAEEETIETKTEQTEEIYDSTSPTGKLADLHEPSPAITQIESETIETPAKPIEMDTSEGNDEVADKDTVELAKMEAARAEVQEDWRRRMAETKTIPVPAVMLEILEKATTLVTSKLSAATTAPAEDKKQQQAAAEEELPTTSGELEALQRDSRQVATAQPLKTPTNSLGEESRYRVTGSQAAIKHSVIRRWGRQTRQKQHRRWLKIISAAVVASILVVLCIPLIVGLMGYNTYTNIKGIATDGIGHLKAIQDLVPANKNDILSALNPQKLTKAQDELSKAQDDFLQLQDIVNRPDIESLTQQFAPQYSNKIDMARHLVQVALDVSRMGEELIGVAQMGANILNGGSLLSNTSNKPLISTDNINAIEAALVHGQYYINDISAHMTQVDLAQLPLGTPSQKAQLTKALGLLPQAQDMITQVQSMIGPISWLLGVGQPRHFLVQTLDRGELRPSGGFEGQYGVLTLQDGRMSPLSLRDVAQLDYNGDGYDIGNHPPAQYKWMDFGNFGLRDANLWADYPTTARSVMDLFQKEGGGPVDGDIQITPVVIAQILQVTGPLYVKDYKVTVTAQNLEDEIHAYQQNYALISKEQQVTGTYNHDTRKAFTSQVGQMLLDKVKKLHVNQLMALSKPLLQDLKTRDLQIYFTNPLAEQWLLKNDYSGAMPTFNNGTDGFMVVQANISISKAAQFVHSTFADNVTLDAGGARHDLTITLNYQQKGPVYGFDSYADYLRVYAPANAQYIPGSGYGFNTGPVVCTPNQPKPKPNPNPNPNPSPTPTPTPKPGSGGVSDPTGSYTDAGLTVTGCGTFYNYYPDSDQRSCPDHNYKLGYDGMQGKAWAIQKLGAPTAFGSDLPGYQMWGGMTLTPKNCTSTISLSWYVPHVVQHTPGQAPYQMVVGHQAGWPVTAQVNVNASALNDKDVKSFSYNQTINVDTLVALPSRPLPPAPKPTTPTPVVTSTATTKKP